MGDRISISFRKEKEESIIFCSHWDGRQLISSVKNYLIALNTYLENLKNEQELFSCPLERLEPGTVMLDFIRWYTDCMGFIKGNYYLGKDENSIDNSDNGHFIIDITKGLNNFKILKKKGS